MVDSKYIHPSEFLNPAEVDRLRALRETQWLAGGAEPLQTCIRGMLPATSKTAPKNIADALVGIDAGYELVFDFCMQVDQAGPAWHLMRKVSSGGAASGDTLVSVFPIQRALMEDVNVLWPLGGPCEPGLWLYEIAMLHYTGPLDGASAMIKQALNRKYHERRELKEFQSTKRAMAREIGIAQEVLPFAPSEFGGVNKTIQKAGYGEFVAKGKRK